MLARAHRIGGVAVAVLIATVVAYLLMAHLSLRLTDTGWPAFLAAQLPGVAMSAAAGGAGLASAVTLRAAGMPPLVVCVGTGAMSSIVAVAAAFVARDRLGIVALVETLLGRDGEGWGPGGRLAAAVLAGK